MDASMFASTGKYSVEGLPWAVIVMQMPMNMLNTTLSERTLYSIWYLGEAAFYGMLTCFTSVNLRRAVYPVC